MLTPLRGEARAPHPTCPWGLARHSAPPPCPQVFALIVFCCIFGEGYSNTHESNQRYCVFNRNEDACRYGSAIGVLAFLACAFFFVVDVYFPQISNAVDRKYLVISDLLFSGISREVMEGDGSSRVPRRSRGLGLGRAGSELAGGAGRGARSPWSRQARAQISNRRKPAGAVTSTGPWSQAS